MDQSLSADFHAHVRPCLDLVDALRNIGVQEKIPIPQIAVMGDQSSGKSSVLEQLSGVQFPRGTGLVTRCATQITMSQGETWSAELRATGGSDVRRVTEDQQAELGRHIEELTTELCGGGDGFCGPDKFIEVKLVAPDAPDLTIIDLPGIVRTHISGQDTTVKEQVDSLLEHFLKQERTIILAVIPVNVDIATVDILERASKVDPDGERTMGVLTKPDLVDKGGEAEVLNVLANRTKPLRHGYFMLKNPSQDDLTAQQGKPVPPADSRSRALAWLKTSKYKEMDDRLGVQALQTALTGLLVTQIKKSLPSMREEVDAVLEQTEGEIATLGISPPPTAGGRRMAALAVVREVVAVLRHTTSSANREPVDVSGPAVIQQELRARKLFAEAVNATRPGFDGERDEFDVEVTDVDSRHALNDGVKEKTVGEILGKKKWMVSKSVTNVGDIISNAYSESGYTKGKIVKVAPYFRGDLAARIEEGRGRELPGFMNFQVFTTQIGEYVQLWEEPTEEFLCEVEEVLKKAADSAVQQHTGNLPRLSDMLSQQLHDHIRSCTKNAEKQLNALLEQEKLPSTENHYLYDTINKIRNKRMEDKIKAMPEPSGHDGHLQKDTVIAMLQSNIGNASNESQEVQDMIDFLAAYWKLAVKRYVDVVCMVLTDTFTAPARIKDIEEKLTNAAAAADDQNLERLFQMDSHVERRRLELKKTREKMLLAREKISDFVGGSSSSMPMGK
jgi:GTP-binding protein EngB required for normal cell division